MDPNSAQAKCLICGTKIGGTGSPKYCKNRACQLEAQRKRRFTFLQRHGKNYLNKKMIEWRRKKGIMPKGKSIAEENIYKKLLQVFDKKEIIRNTYKIIRNPITKAWLELDFYIPHLNVAIEIDGETHRLSNSYGEERLKRQIEIDDLKNKLCLKRGINLVRVPWGKDINIFGDKVILRKDYLEKLRYGEL